MTNVGIEGWTSKVANFDIFDERYRRYQNGLLFPTSHGDYLDRAVKSLAKELEVPVNAHTFMHRARLGTVLSEAP